MLARGRADVRVRVFPTRRCERLLPPMHATKEGSAAGGEGRDVSPQPRDTSGMYNPNRAGVRATEDPEHIVEALFDSVIVVGFLALLALVGVVVVVLAPAADNY